MMQGNDSAKSFLEKLKYGGSNTAFIDNSAPPDADGIIVRRLERQYASEPLSVLGIKISDDGEVLSTENGSPAAKANILPHYMIIYVNNQFVGCRADFEDIAAQHLTLIIKLQTTSAMSELMAKILDDEEKAETENGKPSTDINELLRTTPRYGFLSAEHPMFLRWNHRIQTQREARQLLRQATREAEEQLAKEAFEKIRRELEAEEAKQRESQQVAQPAVNPVPVPAPKPTEEFLLKHVQDESSFGRVEEVTEKMDEVQEEASAEELLKLIGAQPNEEKAPVNKVPENDGEVRFFIIPTEEYKLSNGMIATISVKKRSGPFPKPPPGKPPKGLRGLAVNKPNGAVTSIKSFQSDVVCSFCYLRGHNVDECAEKKEQERRLAFVPKERQICRDYLRGRCLRSDCMMRHVSKHSQGRISPPRKRDRERRHRSRSRHHRGGSRRRHHDGRRRGHRSRGVSTERHRRRR
ncbi:zinc finger ccch and cchc domain-containing protein [Trypanosoma cruzi]|nr:zinc finger ccch and cchc domain-containing protein [Trypanosoma cruzi]